VQVVILTEFIENRISVMARANRTGEIIWLLFLAIRLSLTLSARRLAPLFSIENAFVALLVVCLDVRGLVQGTVDRALWDRSLTADGLRSPMWLYAYEAVTQGFLPGAPAKFFNFEAVPIFNGACKHIPLIRNDKGRHTPDFDSN
jgi:hypothetical protein